MAEEIRAAGGRAETAEVDAYDEQAVDAHADAVVAASGSLDISMNVVPHGDIQGTSTPPAPRSTSRGPAPSAWARTRAGRLC